MIKSILSVVAGYALWTAVFLGGSAGVRAVMAGVHDEAGMTSDITALSAYLILSVVASLAAGFVTAKIADPPRTRWVLITAIALLATGIPVQLSAWDQLPVRYNLAFLLLLLPMTVFGGRMAGSGDENPA